MTTCRVTATLLGLVLLLAVPAAAQTDGGAPKRLADSSETVTLEDGTTYSKDTLAMVYLHRLYARKPKEAAGRATFTGERSERSRDSTPASPAKWKKWKKDEVAKIAAIENPAEREASAVTYLRSMAEKRRNARYLRGMLVFGVGAAGGVLLYLADKSNRETNEDIEERERELMDSGSLFLFEPQPRAAVMSTEQWVMYAGGVCLIAAVFSAIKGGEERAYNSYLKEKGIVPKLRFSVLPPDYPGAGIQFQLSLAFD